MTQRLEEPSFDLIIATNVLVYYDVFEQALALANLTSLLKDHGFLLSNTVLPEIDALPIRVAGLLSTPYATNGSHDVVVWYQHLAEQH